MFTLKKRLNGILALHTGKPVDQIDVDADRDNYMTAKEAADYGLVDRVLEGRKDLGEEEESKDSE
jgi:ATP-dependent Clp protease protease subunit